MRITKLITGENALILNQVLSTILQRNVWRSVWRIFMWITAWGLKGEGDCVTAAWFILPIRVLWNLPLAKK